MLSLPITACNYADLALWYLHLRPAHYDNKRGTDMKHVIRIVRVKMRHSQPRPIHVTPKPEMKCSSGMNCKAITANCKDSSKLKNSKYTHFIHTSQD